MRRFNRQARVNQLKADALIAGLKWFIHRSQANAVLDAEIDAQLDALIFPPEYLDWVIQSRLEEWRRLDAKASDEALKAWSSAIALAITKSGS